MDDQKKKKIEAAIVLVAQIITKREDGSKYLPVYDRLQAELIALSSQMIGSTKSGKWPWASARRLDFLPPLQWAIGSTRSGDLFHSGYTRSDAAKL